MTRTNEPITMEARKKAIQQAIQAADAAVKNGQGTSEEIRWKGSKIFLPVASVDIDLVLLSRDSHRIKAQLESLPQAKRNIVETDPYGVQAQEIIAQLLRETDGYQDIKNALAKDEQLYAGVLTSGGVLVNANTRVVALRELRQQYVKVLVLPEDAGPKEITELELRLQMERDVKQDYSFTSQLLFIEDLVKSGNYTTIEIGRALQPALTDRVADQKKARENVDSQLRLLSLIRSVQAASGGALNLLYFNDKRQALVEIDEDYQKLKTTAPSEAARVRDAQLAGMIANVGYRELRNIDTTLLDTYIRPVLEEDQHLGPHLDVLMSGDAASEDNADLDGLDLLDDEEDEIPVSGTSLSSIYTLMARTKDDEDITLPVADGTSVTMSRKSVAASIFGVITTAIDNKNLDSRHVDRLIAPILHLKEATKAVDKAIDAYLEVHEIMGFDRNKFLRAVQEFQRAAADFTTTTGTAPTAVARTAGASVAGSEAAGA